jgi:hypothetical protein
MPHLDELYRPPCDRCGAPTKLTHIVPSFGMDPELRAYECPACQHVFCRFVGIR